MSPAAGNTTTPNEGNPSNDSTSISEYIVNPLPRSSYPAEIIISEQDLRRSDESADAQFYVQPRFVQHIDDGAIAALKNYYGTVIEPGARVVDLCSSWTSHLPESLKGKLAGCVGYGMNAREMDANGHLTGFWVRDLNMKTESGEGLLMEIPDGTVDVVICNVSVDYLVRPLEVMEEIKKCLKTGGTAHMAFSNRCFPTKVIGKWLKMKDEERRMWVGGYFWAVGGFENVEEVILKDGRDWNDPLFVVRAKKRAEST